MVIINPRNNFNGNAEEIFIFYKSVFGGTFSKIQRFKILSNPDFTIAENEADKIMLIGFRVGKNTNGKTMSQNLREK